MSCSFPRDYLIPLNIWIFTVNVQVSEIDKEAKRVQGPEQTMSIRNKDPYAASQTELARDGTVTAR